MPFDLFDPTEYDVPGSFGVIFTSRDFVDAHPTATQDFIRATMKRAGRRRGRSRRRRRGGDRPRRGQRQPQLPVRRGRGLPLGDGRRADDVADAGGRQPRRARPELLQAEVDAYAAVGLFGGGGAPAIAARIEAAPITGVYGPDGAVIWPG